MTPLRVMVVLGTRPEAIKLAPVLEMIRSRPRFRATVCLTGQHREMLDQVLDHFGITPDIDLALMRPDQTPAGFAAQALEALSDRLGRERPDLVLVQGDTITTFIAAFAAFLARVPVAHVEAGLRTSDRARPFPEEMSRRLTGVVADYHFPPTEGARRNLLAEGIPDARIVVTGNTAIDAILRAADRPHTFGDAALREIDFARPVVLVTMHRRESFGGPLRAAAEAIREIARDRPEASIVFPVHRNPNVRGPMEEILGGEPRIHLIDPVPYGDFVHLMARSAIVLTDSGGIQEEAPSLGIPVLVMRDVTERPEGIAAGVARLVGTDRARIVGETLALIDDPARRRSMVCAANPYGDGRAAERIADALERFLAPA